MSTVEQQVAELVKPGILVAFYLSDGSTAGHTTFTTEPAPLSKMWKQPSLLLSAQRN
jgi:hypothetical protein